MVLTLTGAQLLAYAGAMAWNGYDNEIARLTANVLRRFNHPAPFPPPPSARHAS